MPRPFVKVRWNWKGRTSGTPAGSEKKGWTQTVDRCLLEPRRELFEGASRLHGWRPNAGRCEVDKLVTAADCAAGYRVGNSGQSTRRVPVASQTRVPQAKGSEKEDDGSPQSESQRPVREHRPSQEGVPEGRPASHQHGHEEEGIAEQFLP